jgi:hypothetical protein
VARLPAPEPTSDLARDYGVLAHAPAVLAAFLRLYGHLWQRGVVDHPTKEVVRLRNARITSCGY